MIVALSGRLPELRFIDRHPVPANRARAVYPEPSLYAAAVEPVLARHLPGPLPELLQAYHAAGRRGGRAAGLGGDLDSGQGFDGRWRGGRVGGVVNQGWWWRGVEELGVEGSGGGGGGGVENHRALGDWVD